MSGTRRKKIVAWPAAGLLLSLATAAPAASGQAPMSDAAGFSQEAVVTEVPAIDAPTLRTNPDGDEYLLGAISWGGFRQGTHSAGWRRLEHYPDRRPLLGFYDQDRVEVWDWNIKFAKEHGISYFAFVWTRGSEPGQPATYPVQSHALEAFRESAFSDEMSYTLIWDQLQGTSGVADFENNIWPHFRDHFSDSRYLVLDNRPILYILNPPQIQDVADVVARLRQLVIGEGFDDATILTTPIKRPFSDYGFNYANGQLDCGGELSSACDQFAEAAILDSFGDTKIGNLSMGFDRDPSDHKQFHGVQGQAWRQNAWRFTPAGFESLAHAFRDKMDAESGFVRRLALVSAWNEWVEGHYVAPSVEYGYGYLEGIRQAFSEADNMPYQGDPLADGFGPYDFNFARDAAHYKLDDTTGMTASDSSGWGRHAELRGNPTWQPGAGHDGGGAIELNGTNDFVLLAPVSPGGGPGFMHNYVGLRTVSMWVKAATTSGTRVLYDQGGGSYGIGMRIKNGTLESAIRRQPRLDLLATAYPSDGEWHHVALTYQAKDEDGLDEFYMRLYLDGVLVDELRDKPSGVWRLIRTHQDAGAMGARAGSDAFGDSPTGGYFAGLIDDVRIVPRELRPDEIAAIAGLSTAIVDSRSGGITYKAKGIAPGLYYWTENAHAGDHGGSVKNTAVAGNEALYTFVGDSIRYVARKGPFQARAEVFVDEVSRGVFDLYAPSLQSQQVIFEDTALPPGEHTIRIVHTGTKHPNAQGNLINIDYLQYAPT